ncbi:MAG: hypothetical protein IT521_04195 [Burkholderiales bacterium]|nr:hypothetical protein [Burkholderiales bacterium]
MAKVDRSVSVARSSLPHLALAVLTAAIALHHGSVQAKPSQLKPLESWSGRVPLGVPPPLQSSLANQEDFRRVWAQCQVKGTVPTIDFDRRLVLVAVRRGSVVRFQRLTLDSGNLRTGVVETPDMPPYMTCTIVLVDRAGTTKVNGAPIGR